jgi:hypothetical protein
MSDQLGTVKLLGLDKDGYERRERLEAIAECPTCGEDVELWSDTTAWVEVKEHGRTYWRHSEYGPAAGDCCDKAIVSWWEGTFVIG